LTKTNDPEIEVIFKEYGCREDIFGSDHRPVFLNFNVDLKLNHLMDPNHFFTRTDQGSGNIKLKNFKLQFSNNGMQTTKKKFVFPLFFQLKFCGEFLTTNPNSFEKRIIALSEPMTSKLWKEH
jgi:hypothetical protein